MTPLLFQEINEPGRENYVGCQVCLRRCIIAPNQTGFCGNRVNRTWPAWNGKFKLEDLVHNNIFVLDDNSTLGDKPILYLPDGKGGFVDPKTRVVSVGGLGCNLDCKECPNPSMSHPSKRKNSGIYSPGSVVSYAKLRGFKFIAMTYNEPVPFPETCIELTKKAREAEIETVLVTNTTFTPEFIEEYHRSGGRIIRLDLKATLAQMNEFYFRYCGLKIVEGEEVVTGKKILESIKRAKDLGLHLELMTAVTLNSYPLNNVGCSSWTIPQTADWIRENLGAETPWHLTLLVPRRGLSEIDQRYGPQRLDSYARVARSRGLVNVDIYQKMCDCKEGELFKSGGNSCCDKRE